MKLVYRPATTPLQAVIAYANVNEAENIYTSATSCPEFMERTQDVQKMADGELAYTLTIKHYRHPQCH